MTEVSSSVKACLFINNINQERHGEFKHGLANSYASGADNYLKDVGEALSRAVNYLRIQPAKTAQQQSGDGLTFVQRKGSRGGENSYDRKEPGDTDYLADITCYACDKKGHYASDCPEKEELKALRSKKKKEKPI